MSETDATARGSPTPLALFRTAGVRLLAALLTVRRWLTTVRVRAHFRRTERALRDADTDGLDGRQRVRREATLDALRDYRERGTVPTNTGESERVPQFLGANGAPCAVAALALADGQRGLVEGVATRENDLRAEDLPEDPERGVDEHRRQLAEWLDSSGLTREEAARVQPAYPTEVLFATDCGPVSCAVARALVSTAAVAVFAASEFVGYRLASDLFPENPFKRRGTLAYLTVMNCLLAPLVGVALYALFP
jgi:hypothetical protein